MEVLVNRLPNKYVPSLFLAKARVGGGGGGGLGGGGVVGLILFDLILNVHSTIFQLCGTGLPGLNQY